MPIYEYQCRACGHTIEVIQKISDQPLSQCPDCHKDTLGKCISATSFHLKGNGWYVTDFKDKGTASSKPCQQASNENKASEDKAAAAPVATTDSSSAASTQTASESQ